MYPVSANFHSLSIQDAPTTRIRIYFIDDTVDCADDNDVQTNGTLLVNAVGDTDTNGRIAERGVVFNNYFNPDKNIQIGACVSSEVSMTLLNLDGALDNFTFGRCKIYLDVYDEANSAWLNCPMGVYLIEQPIGTAGKKIDVHGFDQMQLLDAPAETWWNTIDWSTGLVSLYTLITGICTAVGVPWSVPIESDRNIKFMKYPYTPMDISTKSFRDVLKQIAESTGSMAYFTRNGELDLRWFSYAKVTGYATYTGQTISIVNGVSKTVESLTVPITPTQNFNGYTKPWPAGGGENKFAPIEGSDNLITFVAQPDGSVKISGTGYRTKWTARNVTYDLPYNGINAGDTVTIWSDIFFMVTPYNGNTSLGAKSSSNGSATTFTIPANANKLRLGENAKAGQVQQGEVIDVVGHFYIGKVDAFTAWSPYSNICPLIGLTGLSEYVSPTLDIADATTYSVDWTAEAGTVYGGSYEAVSGELKTRPYIASYNGETLVGPWLSSMDEYAAGTTPTTGAEVVDLGGAETTYQLTPTQISLLTGQNYLWASNGETLTAVTGGRTELTIDTDQVGNQCLSIGIANYDVEKFGRIETRLGTSKLVQTKTSAAYPNPKNQYLIDGNAFLNPNAPPLTTDEYIYVILERLWDLTPYTPIQTRLILDWSVDAGDIIQIKRNNVVYVFPIFQISMTWRGGNVVADVTNDGDVVKPYTDSQNEQTKDAISQFIVNGGAGTVSTDLTFTPGESALVVISGAATVRTAAFIVYCDAYGTILKRDISSGSAYSYVTSTPYTVTIQNSSHNNNSGLRISF